MIELLEIKFLLNLMVKLNINNINGWILLDKQKGITSRQAVTKISNFLGVKKTFGIDIASIFFHIFLIKGEPRLK